MAVLEIVRYTPNFTRKENFTSSREMWRTYKSIGHIFPTPFILWLCILSPQAIPGPCWGLWDRVKVGEFSPAPLLQPHDRPQPCHRGGAHCVWTGGDQSGDSLALTSGGSEGGRAPDTSAPHPFQESPDTLRPGWPRAHGHQGEPSDPLVSGVSTG